LTYYTYDEALNFLKISAKWISPIVAGLNDSCQFLSEMIGNKVKSNKKNCIIAIDGFIGVDFLEIAGKDSTFKFGFNDRKIKEAFLANPVEDIIKPVNITNNFINISIKPFELLTFKIKL